MKFNTTVVVVIFLLGALAGSASSSVVQLDISGAVNYDAIVTDAEITYANTTYADAHPGEDHRVVEAIGDHNVQYGSAYYTDGTIDSFPADGLVGVNSYYEIGKGQTDRYGVIGGDALVDQTIYLSANNNTQSTTVTLQVGQQANYDKFNMLFYGGMQDIVADRYSASVKVKYVGDATLYTVYDTTCNGTIGGGFATGSFSWDDATDPNPAFQHAYTVDMYGGSVGSAGSRNTSARSGARYLWEFATPLDLDETKTLESIEISVTSNASNRSNTVGVMAITVETIPEPAMMGLLAMGGLSLLRRKRK